MEINEQFNTRVGPFALMFISRVLLPAETYLSVSDPRETDFAEKVRWSFHLSREEQLPFQGHLFPERIEIEVGMKDTGDGNFLVLVRDDDAMGREDDDPWWSRTVALAEEFSQRLKAYERALDIDSQLATEGRQHGRPLTSTRPRIPGMLRRVWTGWRRAIPMGER